MCIQQALKENKKVNVVYFKATLNICFNSKIFWKELTT
jgi:hypothetical protein